VVGAAVLVGAALVGVVVCWLCWDADVDADVDADAGDDDAEFSALEVAALEVAVLLLAPDSADVEVEADVEGDADVDADDEVAESLCDGALGVLVGGATAGTNSAADGGTV
jgi:hypothetical protein